ncbi:MAG: hypothetical protein GXN91_01340 [Epsilonproteobacteria bacterium]|nr:hypothetical protein [Campylobacterota bacterium]
MKSEIKLALSVLVAGIIGLGGLYYYKKGRDINSHPVALDSFDKKIILPQIGDEYDDIEEVREYLEDLEELYSQGKSVLPLEPDELDEDGEIAQEIALNDAEFLADTTLNGKPLHNDIMKVQRAPIAMLDDKLKELCKDRKCYVVEKYNFALNSTTRAIVDLKERRVVRVRRYDKMQPDISNRLTQIAKAIALKSPTIIKELGHRPTARELSMANVRTNLKESPCEDKEHLCVAPTFPDHQKQQALWAIVDLTKLRLVAAKWAGLGKTYTPACIDERTLQNRYIMEEFCQKDNNYSKDGWEFKYHLTSSDGLEIRDLKFNGKNIARSLKVVDWHVAYKAKGADNLDTSTPLVIEGRRVEVVKGENDEYMFGYNDAMGCPMFSTSVVLAFNGPQIGSIIENNKEVGFYILQDFRNPKWPMACNYRYQNRFEFYKDGSFRVVAINLGRGCGDRAIYRPVMRLDVNLDNHEEFAIYDGEEFRALDIEGNYTSTGKEKMYKDRFLYRIRSLEDEELGFYIEPNRGQFGDGSRGDNERVYVSKFKPQEGDEDMLTLGSCCKLDEDGPERFIEDKEVIENEHIVIWYVPRIYNDNREGQEYCWADSDIDEYGNPSVKIWPCIVGPKFVPIKNVDRE